MNKQEFNVLKHDSSRNSIGKTLIFLFSWFLSLLIVIGVCYYLVSAGYFQSVCNPELVCNETLVCEAVDCGDTPVTFPSLDCKCECDCPEFPGEINLNCGDE